jgi:lipopolysaccharide export LptBFGC system permease protein LptF
MCALAIAIRREQYSIGVTIGLSLIWIIVFYIIRTFCDAFGKLGIFSDWVSTGIPFFIIFIISMGILWRNR